jgi:hypothetical protein
MRRFARLLLRSLIVVLLLAAVSYSPQDLGASCPARFDTYYDYGWSMNLIGWRDRDCGCALYGSGAVDGLWKVSEFYDCDYTEVLETRYYGRCNPGDPWSERSGPTDYPNWC